MRIAAWSGPRNLSTVMMYAFAARGDCAVVDEPFYAAYLAATGLDHPMRPAVLAAQPSDPAVVAGACLGPIPQGKGLFYQKHMAHHMLPAFDRGFASDCQNLFLIRHPARVVASYAKKREAPVLGDLGFAQQADIFDRVANATDRTPLVVDSADVRDDPAAMMRALCAALNIPFTQKMLRWPAGPKPFDGVWAPHWYGAVHLSTGFEGAEGPLPVLPDEYRRLTDQAMPFYEKLARHRLGKSG